MRHTKLLVLVVLLGCQPQQWETVVDTSKPTAKPAAEPTTPDVASDPATTAATDETNDLVGEVVRVIDGDTIDVLVHQETVRVRLEGIDCPEQKQPYGTKAKQALSELVFGKQVRVKSIGKDRYDRTLGRVFVNVQPTEPDVDIEEADANQFLVFHGFAWHYKQYSDDVSLAQTEQDAREAKRGLWADSEPIPPWDWRKGERPKGSQQ